MSKLFRLKNELLQILVGLEQSIYIYLQCTETNFGKTVRILGPTLKDSLANNQCSITDDPEEADFIITVTASTREHDGNVAYGGVMKYSLADVEVEVYSNLKRKMVFNNSFSQKNRFNGASYESAGRDALKLAAGKAWEGMKPWIVGE